MVFELKFKIEPVKQKGNFRAPPSAQSLRQFAELSRDVHGSCFWEAPERRERRRTSQNEPLRAEQLLYCIPVISCTCGMVWHALASGKGVQVRVFKGVLLLTIRRIAVERL